MDCKNKKHPKKVNNLVDGKCGTCKMMREWESIAKSRALGAKGRAAARGIAKYFRDGKIVYDTNGKSMVQFEKELREQQAAEQLKKPTKGTTHGTHRTTAKSTARLKHRYVPKVRGHRKAQG